MTKFRVGDIVRVCKRDLLSYGEQFEVTRVDGSLVYHGNLWNDENELELVVSSKKVIYCRRQRHDLPPSGRVADI